MLKEYIFDNKFQLFILNDMIDILNYTDIISFSDTKVVLKHAKGKLEIKGNNLIISKLLDNEILIKGKLLNIEFR